MRRASLIVNPAAGRAQRLAMQMPAIRELLLRYGYQTVQVETSSANGSAGALAAEAANTASLVLACGGDGTVFDVIQGLAHSGVSLGVVPLGTANALARNLDLPMDPLQAVARLLTYKPQTIPLGELDVNGHTRLFAVMAGCGPDGALVHALSQVESSRLKRRFGRQAYYVHAARLFLTRRWPAFQVEFRRPGALAWQRRNAVAIMASRIPDLGGVFGRLARSALMTDPHLHLQLLHPPAQLSLAAWMVCGRLLVPNPWLTTVNAAEVRCSALHDAPVYVQADAEPMGALPFTLRVVSDALTLLMPAD